MEDIKQLTIESVEVFRTGSSAKGPWTLYNVRANGEKYSTFLDLSPGETATFKIETKPSDRLDRNGRPYMNRTILGYTGSIDEMPAKPHRSADAQAAPAAGVEQVRGELRELAEVVSALLARIERLEGAGFEWISAKAAPDESTLPF